MRVCRPIHETTTSGLWALFWVVCVLSSCGYRPMASLGDGVESSIYVPVFQSYSSYPELDVQAGSYFSTRLAARGLRVTSSERASDLSAQGVVLRAHEETLMLQENSTVSEVVVSARVDVRGEGDRECSTATVDGRAMLVVSQQALSEPDFQAALQEATEQAIESLLNDVILCIEQVSGDGISN